jgi:hypothetical protein
MEHDHTKIVEQAGHLRTATVQINKTVTDVAKSAIVRQFFTTQRDAILAKYTKKYLEQGKSKGIAEVYAQTDTDYLKELENLQTVNTEAEKVLRQDKANYAAFEGNRSLISLSKRIKDDLQG